MELSVMDRINLILSDPEKATMTLAQIVSEEIREFKKSEQYQIILEAESYYRNRSSVQKKTIDVANRSNAKIERPILKKLVDQKANYLLSKPWTVDTESGEYGEALNKVFDQTFRRKIKSLGKGAVKSGIAWIQPYFDDAGELAFMRVPSTEVVPLWRDSERTKLDAFIRFYDQIIMSGPGSTRSHTPNFGGPAAFATSRRTPSAGPGPATSTSTRNTGPRKTTGLNHTSPSPESPTTGKKFRSPG